MDYTRLSDANIITEKYMDNLLIEPRYIDSVVADTSLDFWGEKFSMPVMTPAFSHLGNYQGREYNGLEEYSIAAKESNILNFCGMMENDQFKKIADTGAKTVRIVKPYADNGKVKDQMQYAQSVGAFGVGMDIDHIFGDNGYDIVVGENMSYQTADMLRCYVKIIVDCGISSGADVFKALALGADAACVGRSMLPSLENDGVNGVKSFINHIGDELRYIMSCTGFATVYDINDSVIHYLS